jgi:hypothetical protein
VSLGLLVVRVLTVRDGDVARAQGTRKPLRKPGVSD